MNKKRYTITAALPYANGPIHIGHLAGVYIPADIYARYMRLKGNDVIFISGSDEHGVPITIRAQREGTTPQLIVDKYHNLNKTTLKEFGISFDIFTRTTSDTHKSNATDFFETLKAKNALEQHTEEQFYDPASNQFLSDRYIIGTCPKCGNTEAYGDQCESCGTTLSPDELINPRSMLSNATPILKSTTHWYLPLNKYTDWLKTWLLETHKDWKPNVYGQCKSWLTQDLHKRAITRDLSWGIQLVDDPNKVLYVWFEAPIGYITGTKEWATEKNKDWKPYWQDPSTQLIHFIGKDNIVFHCIIFPVMLKEVGDYILPTNIVGNEFLNLEGRKISTSKNWAVWLPEYLIRFPDKQDILRYVLCANAPEAKDSDFTWADFQTRNNSELVMIVGNFIHRVLTLISRYYNCQVPNKSELDDLSLEITKKIQACKESIEENIEKFQFRKALISWLELARIGNKYLADTEPWKLKDDTKKNTIMFISVNIVANIAVLGEPFLPFYTKQIMDLLQIHKTSWETAGTINLIHPGQLIQNPKIIFHPIQDEEIQREIDIINNSESA
jgi:methionyl-tRNA synthetase